MIESDAGIDDRLSEACYGEERHRKLVRTDLRTGYEGMGGARTDSLRAVT
jgi:hypothetical protein